MASAEHFGVRFVIGEAFTTPTSDNNNWRLKHDWMTPAELMQLIRQEKERAPNSQPTLGC